MLFLKFVGEFFNCVNVINTNGNVNVVGLNIILAFTCSFIFFIFKSKCID